MSTAIAAVRSVLFALLFYLGSVPIVAFAVIVSRLAPASVVPVARFWAGWFAVTTRVVLGIRCHITGDVPTTPVLAAFKHQAAYETIMILRLFRAPAAVMKAELTRIPLWSAAARGPRHHPGRPQRIDRRRADRARLGRLVRADDARRPRHPLPGDRHRADDRFSRVQAPGRV